MTKFKTFLLLLLVVSLFYGTSLRYGFSQDDFFHLTISRAHNLTQFFNFFNPLQVDWIFFRPLSTQLPYFLAFTLFGLTYAPLALHLAMILLHTLNAYLVTRIGEHYLPPAKARVLGVLYAASCFHFLSLFYIGAIQQLLSTMFSLLAISILLRGRSSSWLIALFTLGALLSKELALRLPLILFFLAWVEHKNITHALKRTFVPILVASLYVLLRLLVQTGGATEYVFNFNPATTLATLMWYGLFSLGFPELILRYGLSGGMVNFLAFFADNPYARLPILFAVLPLAVVLLRRLWLLRNNYRYFLFLLPAIIALLPVMFLPAHRYPHYLDLSFLFIGIWVLSALGEFSRRTLLVPTFIVLGMFFSLRLEESTHWTIKRARQASEATEWILDSHSCQSPQGVIFVGAPDQLRELGYALSLSNGPRVICNNPQLPVYYEGIYP